jgi:hypothetical protein
MNRQTQPSLIERLGNALAYIIAFPFIAVFIAMKNAFTKRKGPAHSHYNKLPEQHYIGQSRGKEA